MVESWKVHGGLQERRQRLSSMRCKGRRGGGGGGGSHALQAKRGWRIPLQTVPLHGSLLSALLDANAMTHVVHVYSAAVEIEYFEIKDYFRLVFELEWYYLKIILQNPDLLMFFSFGHCPNSDWNPLPHSTGHSGTNLRKFAKSPLWQ